MRIATRYTPATDKFVEWYCNGLLHRDPDENGQPLPAILYADAEGYKEWWSHDRLTHYLSSSGEIVEL